MWNLIYMTVVAIVALSICKATSNKFIADFSDAGVEGYFEISYQNGNAVYEYKIDLSTLSTSCDILQGLTYHVHSYWTDNSVKASTISCAYTGGHYDPFLACGGSSEDKGSHCVELNRTASQSYNYACNSADYSTGHVAICEVGDLSGKFGPMMPSLANNMVFVGKHIDTMPPTPANYYNEDAVSKKWASLVLHCPADNSRILCAQFLPEKC